MAERSEAKNASSFSFFLQKYNDQKSEHKFSKNS